MKILKFTIIFCLCMFLTSNIILGSEIEKPVPPVVPTELTEQNINIYNQQVQQYNAKVNEYNQSQQGKYNQELLQYNNSLIHNQEEDEKVKQVEAANNEETNRVNEINQQREEEALVKQEEAIQHNEEEDQKVADNQQALENQEKTEQYIEMFEERGISNATSDPEDLPADWTETTTSESTKTIKVEQAEELSDENYNVMNIHFYLNENSGDSINNEITFDENDNPVFSDDLKNNFVSAEWETIIANKNDIVTTISESEAMGYKSAAFYRYMQGYTNGYWIPDYTIFMSNAVYSDSIWYKGVAQEFSYIDGTTDRQPITNVISLYTYSFYRLGNEPEKVEKYTPDYWNTEFPVEYEQPNYQTYTPNYIIKNNPAKPTPLNQLTYLIYTPPIVPTKPVQEEPIYEELIIDLDVVSNDSVVLIPIDNMIIEDRMFTVQTSPRAIEIEIEDLDVPLAGGKQLYDYRGIPVQYSPRESGVYAPSNRGLKPINRYLVKR